jgi:hypothetical protein
MPKPTPVETIEADAGTDRPNIWREAALDLSTKFNSLVTHMTEFMWGLLSSANAAEARQQLGVLDPVHRWWSYGSASNIQKTSHTDLNLVPSFLATSAGAMTVDATSVIAPRTGIYRLRSPRCEVVEEQSAVTAAFVRFARFASGTPGGFATAYVDQYLQIGMNSFEICLLCQQGDAIAVQFIGQGPVDVPGSVSAVLSGYSIELVA